jgi:putative ubiquitin-RnfH superfamily antitoxin RatB of RatAB toxin-antitoxin module
VSDQESKKNICVEVVLALPEKQKLVAMSIAAGSTLADAIEKSAIADMFEEFELDLTRVGIFGRKASPDQVLRDGDRVEIYRPLIADPKEVRRQRALKQAEIRSANKQADKDNLA